MRKEIEVSRRKVLSLAGGLGASSIVLPNGRAKKGPKLPEQAKKTFEKRYGAESTEIVEILSPLYQQYKSGRLSYEEYYNNATFEFLQGESTPQLREDIIETWESMPRAHRPENPIIKENTAVSVQSEEDEWVEKAPPTDSYQNNQLSDQSDITSEEVETQSNTLQYRWASSEYDYGSSGAGSSDVHVALYVGDEYSYKGRQKAKATVGLYGSAWAYVRFYRRFSPVSSGMHTLRVKAADIKGDGTTGSTTFSLYAEDSDGHMNSKQADSVTKTEGEDRYYYKDFSLDSSEEYKLGFELYCTTQTGGGAGTSDYYSNDRGVTPNYQQSQYPEYYFEIETP